jgi:NADH-quinone oxidoreductase subunit E
MDNVSLAQFRFTAVSRKRVMVCRGTACHVKWAPRILEEIERIPGIKERETRQDLEYAFLKGEAQDAG